MPRVLIVAYGNPLRSDDGLAWRAAAELEERLGAGKADSEVEILRLHQLGPELAETIRGVSAVIFVDAASGGGAHPGEVRCEEIPLMPEETRFSHHLSPATVIALASQLYSARPRAFCATLTGECFDHGESLSPTVEGALPLLIARVEALARQALSAVTGEFRT